MGFVHINDSDQPQHQPSQCLMRVIAWAHWIAKDLSFLHVDSELKILIRLGGTNIHRGFSYGVAQI